MKSKKRLEELLRSLHEYSSSLQDFDAWTTVTGLRVLQHANILYYDRPWDQKERFLVDTLTSMNVTIGIKSAQFLGV